MMQHIFWPKRRTKKLERSHDCCHDDVPMVKCGAMVRRDVMVQHNSATQRDSATGDGATSVMMQCDGTLQHSGMWCDDVMRRDR